MSYDTIPAIEYLHKVVGTEQDAKECLMEFVDDVIRNEIQASNGYMVMQDGMSIVVSEINSRSGEAYPRQIRFTAARVLTVQPPRGGSQPSATVSHVEH